MPHRWPHAPQRHPRRPLPRAPPPPAALPLLPLVSRCSLHSQSSCPPAPTHPTLQCGWCHALNSVNSAAGASADPAAPTLQLGQVRAGWAAVCPRLPPLHAPFLPRGLPSPPPLSTAPSTAAPPRPPRVPAVCRRLRADLRRCGHHRLHLCAGVVPGAAGAGGAAATGRPPRTPGGLAGARVRRQGRGPRRGGFRCPACWRADAASPGSILCSYPSMEAFPLPFLEPPPPMLQHFLQLCRLRGAPAGPRGAPPGRRRAGRRRAGAPRRPGGLPVLRQGAPAKQGAAGCCCRRCWVHNEHKGAAASELPALRPRPPAFSPPPCPCQCTFYKPSGAHHCSACGCCVMDLDHHCLCAGPAAARGPHPACLLPAGAPRAAGRGAAPALLLRAPLMGPPGPALLAAAVVI